MQYVEAEISTNEDGSINDNLQLADNLSLIDAVMPDIVQQTRSSTGNQVQQPCISSKLPAEYINCT